MRELQEAAEAVTFDISLYERRLKADAMLAAAQNLGKISILPSGSPILLELGLGSK